MRLPENDRKAMIASIEHGKRVGYDKRIFAGSMIFLHLSFIKLNMVFYTAKRFDGDTKIRSNVTGCNSFNDIRVMFHYIFIPF